MDKIKAILPYLVIIGCAAALLVWLFPSTHADGGMAFPLDDRAIDARSREILRSLDIDVSSMRPDISARRSVGLIRQLQMTFGLARANELARDSVVTSYWQVRWSERIGSSLRFSSRGDDDRAMREAISMLRGDLNFHLDTHGRLLVFTREMSDSTRAPAGTEANARRVLESFVRTWCRDGAQIADSVRATPVVVVDRQNRRDYQFTWKGLSGSVHNPVTYTATVAGTLLTQFEASETVPSAFEESQYRSAITIAITLMFVIVGIIMLIVAVRRIRSYELGFRLAIAVGIITGVLYDLEIFLSMSGPITWQFLIALIVTPVFIGGAMVLIWAVAESLARETWREKLIGFDLISHGHLLHPLLGLQTIRGIALGLGTGAVWLILLRTIGAFVPVWAVSNDSNSISQFSIAVPWLYVLGRSLAASVFSFAFFVIFGLSALRVFLRKAPLIIGLATVAMLVVDLSGYAPLPVGVIASGTLALGFLWAFYRYDALTSIVAIASWSAIQDAAGLLGAGHPSYTTAGMIVLLFFGGLLVLSVAVQFRKEVVTDFETVAPAFARFISERQRLQQELEIARSVQMSFLPKRNPVRYRLDIASRCAPALEVGGDYYDFIELTEAKLGVAIGDVSGKGTQAAFFMTLTKGFLRALANVSNSPASILTQVNKLFYESVDRGMFISMVYGIFDTEEHALTLSRAGHNPVIVHKSLSKDVQTMNPMGLALGLDAGETFARSIQEVRIPFQQGDVFVFYTDGFPEAMNKAREEFGESRLADAVTRHAGRTASEIMEGVFHEMKAFVGNAKQHDDLTIVVVKIS